MKKKLSPARIEWINEQRQRRWEVREERQLLFFSQPSCLLPRQISLQIAARQELSPLPPPS